ncbi:MBL fold metallo-hydrolase [Streptomyces sp. AJS327]|uniref:MBL fold metallo-hydrolase n=1 Tax=Streptomyces sp. AJS327 TaxID=2545265 RepID=UPI0015DE855B|nr:MBL fold metallo-hydrolase [Streptomyces sp. AJS327]MBA0049881.1 MBL fold metallo-hydrolase [Streptomyces sp. AJS327]
MTARNENPGPETVPVRPDDRGPGRPEHPGPGGPGADAAAPPARWEHLAPGVARRRLPGWDATVGAIAGDGGTLLVDSGSSLREGAGIRREVVELFGRPVTHVALTHGHFDHVLGTAAFAGVRVYGAVGLAGRLAEGREALRGGALAQGLSPHDTDEALDVLVVPDHPVSGELTLTLGEREVLLANLGPAHSGHDLVVCVPGEREVVFCGDLVEESGEPQAGRDAVPARWPAALDRLLELGGEDARYVPGHGAVVDADFVRAQRDQLARRFGVGG